MAASQAVQYEVIDVATHPFVAAQTQIKSGDQIQQWLKSEAASMMMDFIQTLNEPIKRLPLSSPCFVSEIVVRIQTVFQRLTLWIDEIPPEQQAQRYGNKSFRVWYARVVEHAPSLLAEILPEHLHRAIIEVTPYFLGSWGNDTRIDYGTGHEFAFVAWMCCLELIGAFKPEDHVTMVFKVFAGYLQVMRKIQRVYGLEPAGSHGVWGLDDYQFMPFLWGAAQLIDHPTILPKSILTRSVVQSGASEYLYLAAIEYIYQVKTGAFNEHSPLLYDITGVPNWTKVNFGLHKMLVGEVLKKFPIMQHFPTGSLLRLTPSSNPNPLLVT